MGIHSEAQLNRKFMEFAALMNIYLNHFPKHEKYALSNRIRNTAYEMYDLISESQKRYYKDELGKMIGAWIKKIKEENKWS